VIEVGLTMLTPQTREKRDRQTKREREREKRDRQTKRERERERERDRQICDSDIEIREICFEIILSPQKLFC